MLVGRGVGGTGAVRVPPRVEWIEGRAVGASVDGPADATVVVVLAHGAGAGRHHPFLAGLSRRLASGGLLVVRFDYPYAAEGRRAPDRLATLLAAHRAVVSALPLAGRRLLLAGKSMGGRVGSHLHDVGAAGWVFLGYPLVAAGTQEPRDTAHLGALRSPLLFVQGERDRLAPLDLLAPIVGRLEHARLVVIPEADHSFRVPQRAGVTEGEMLDHLAKTILAWEPAQAPGGAR